MRPSNSTTRVLATGAAIWSALVGPIAGQSTPGSPSSSRAIKQNQLTIDVGLLALGIGYAEGIGGRSSVGVRLWAAWEAPATFDRPFFDPRGVEVFARYQVTRTVQAEVGPSFLRYADADDCSNCTRTFLGVRGAALAGRRLRFGPEIRFGAVTGGPRPAETGVVLGVQLRLLFDWDK